MTRSESLDTLHRWAEYYRHPDIIAQRREASPARGKAVSHGLAAVRAIREPISYCKNDCLSDRILVSRDWPGSGRMADPVEEDCQACNATRSKSQARLAVRAALDAIGIHGAL